MTPFLGGYYHPKSTVYDLRFGLSNNFYGTKLILGNNNTFHENVGKKTKHLESFFVPFLGLSLFSHFFCFFPILIYYIF